MLTLSRQYRFLPGAASDRAGRPVRARRLDRAKTRQARRLAGESGHAPFANCSAACQSSFAAGRGPLPAAGAHAGAVQECGDFRFGRLRPASFRARTGVARPRGCSLDRSDDVGTDDAPHRFDRVGTRSRRRHRAAGIRFPMGGAGSRADARPQPPQQNPVRRDRCRNRGRAFARFGRRRRYFGTDRWHAVVRRRTDAHNDRIANT